MEHSVPPPPRKQAALGTVKVGPASKSECTAGSSTRVLIVDDDKSILMALRRALGRRMQVTTADNGFDALRHLAMAHFDAVVSDYRMPQIDGIRVLRTAMKRFPQVRRILLSGHHIGGIDELVRMGVVEHYLQKPVELEELLDCLALHRDSDP